MPSQKALVCDSYAGCADKPPADTLPRATQWQCDVCDQTWVVVEGAQYNESYSAWRRLTEKNVGGHDR